MDLSVIISLVSLFGTIVIYILSKVYNLGEASKKIEYLEKSVDKLVSEMKDVREDMIRVQTVLTMKHKGVEEVFSIKHSPRMLNDLGSRMFMEMNGAGFLDQNKVFLFSKIDERAPQTALDVEEAAQWACSAFVNEPFYNPIKNFVYNCPLLKRDDGSEFEFTLGSAAFILGLKLRDLYLEAHPEFEQSIESAKEEA